MTGQEGGLGLTHVSLIAVFQMLWWGMDETVAGLFAHHPQASNFDGNPWDAFGAKIWGSEYGLDETPRLIVLYRGQYNVIVNPGECMQWA